MIRARTCSSIQDAVAGHAHLVVLGADPGREVPRCPRGVASASSSSASSAVDRHLLLVGRRGQVEVVELQQPGRARSPDRRGRRRAGRRRCRRGRRSPRRPARPAAPPTGARGCRHPPRRRRPARPSSRVRERGVGVGVEPGALHRGHDVLAGQDVALDGVPGAGRGRRPSRGTPPRCARRRCRRRRRCRPAGGRGPRRPRGAAAGPRGPSPRRRGGPAPAPCRRRWRRPGSRWRRRPPPPPAPPTRRPGTSRPPPRPRTRRRRSGPRSRRSCPEASGPVGRPGRVAEAGGRAWWSWRVPVVGRCEGRPPCLPTSTGPPRWPG